MGLTVSVNRKKADVREAILQFAARRSYRLSYPWYLDGARIEDRRSRDAERRPHSQRRWQSIPERVSQGVWRLLDFDAPPRIEVAVRPRLGRTDVRITLGSHPASVEMAYALRAYLSNNRAYECLCPPMCPTCTAPVANVMARYCGRCGRELLPSAVDIAPPPVQTGRPIAAPDVTAASAGDVELARDREPVAEASPAADERTAQDCGTGVSPVDHHAREAGGAEHAAVTVEREDAAESEGATETARDDKSEVDAEAAPESEAHEAVDSQSEEDDGGDDECARECGGHQSAGLEVPADEREDAVDMEDGPTAPRALAEE